jgi:phage N-6-adenine-methyltransferase
MTGDVILPGAELPQWHYRTNFSGDNEWYTPAKYIEAARKVMGGIDLDPASNAVAQEIVRAGRYFTKDDDGLAQEWHGRVWLNPPYSRDLIRRFISKLVAEARAGNVTEAVLLVNNHSDTAWFHEAAGSCSAFCSTRGRVKFYAPDKRTAAPQQGQTFFYFGPRPAAFEKVFGALGYVARTRHVIGRAPCPMCGGSVAAIRRDARFCSDKCRQRECRDRRARHGLSVTLGGQS